MAHTVKKDPFVPLWFLISAGLLGGAVFVLVSNLYTTVVRNSIKGAEDNSRQVAVVAESLKPVGHVVTTADEPAAAAPASSGTADGAAVYEATCKACHATGVAEAPLFGDKEKWEARVATGLDSMMNTALNGRGAMPARGGNPALSDEEIKAAILHMTKAAGFDLGGGDAAKQEAPAAASAKTEPAKEAPTTAPVKTEPAKASAKAEPTQEAPAVEKKAEPIAPAQPEPVSEPKKPAIPTTPSTPAIPVTPPTPAAPEAPAPKVDAAATGTVATLAKEAKPAPAKESTGADLKKGESVYNSMCFACHKTGIAGAPLFGDKTLWAPRIATGLDAMLGSVINGKGAMPPRAGTSLSDAELKDAVAYMVSQAK